MAIAEFFQAVQQHAALQAYEQFSVTANWPTAELFHSYAASRPAFEPSTNRSDALRVFTTEVYENLKNYWMVFRSSNQVNDYWSAERVFDVIGAEFAELGWNSRITLASVTTAMSPDEMVSRLETLRAMKPNRGFPVMAASKFLHFFNPRLFPIYDNEIIWKRVIKTFKADFKSYCFRAGLGYDMTDSAVFLRNYIWWASSLVRGAHPEFMDVFSQWAAKHSVGGLRRNELATLYATAFELTAIGAERVEAQRH